mmetsp:Transcript_2307/g.2426  ORF Transcript_2307/g.2426 Transcript_2307/m.2426 type:complete len:233 (-) Transcript_2307:1-699(-)
MSNPRTVAMLSRTTINLCKSAVPFHMECTMKNLGHQSRNITSLLPRDNNNDTIENLKTLYSNSSSNKSIKHNTTYLRIERNRNMGYLKSSFCTDTKPVSRKNKKKTENEKIIGFNEQATIGIIYIARALSPLVPMNPGYSLGATHDISKNAFELSIDNDPIVLTLETGVKGPYIFSIDRQNERLIVQSPISGIFQYAWDVESKLWLGSVDRHDLRGLITRDLLRHATGLCAF